VSVSGWFMELQLCWTVVLVFFSSLLCTLSLSLCCADEFVIVVVCRAMAVFFVRTRSRPLYSNVICYDISHRTGEQPVPETSHILQNRCHPVIPVRNLLACSKWCYWSLRRVEARACVAILISLNLGRHEVCVE
jgi:hypothetical protein